jgi:hypothetical protein
MISWKTERRLLHFIAGMLQIEQMKKIMLSVECGGWVGGFGGEKWLGNI